MKYLLRITGCALSLAICAGSVAAGESPHPIKQIRYLMGTLCEIAAYPPSSMDRDTAEQAIAAAFAELKRIDGVLSNWNPNSELMRLNLEAGAEGSPRPRVHVGDELFERLRVALEIARQSGGVFDPTVGPLVRVWGFLPRCQTDGPCSDISRADAIAAAKRKVGWRKISLHPETKEVEFTIPGVEIDLGGIAKGYAAERAAQVLKEHGIRAALVNLGSSSLKAVGYPPCSDRTTADCKGWVVAVADPRNRRRSAARIVLHDGDSLATSGTYEHTVGEGRKRKSHLFDPFTGAPLGGESSVSVICHDAELADALTKPFILRRDLTSPYAAKLLNTYEQCGVSRAAVQDARLSRQFIKLNNAQVDGIPEYWRGTAPDR